MFTSTMFQGAVLLFLRPVHCQLVGLVATQPMQHVPVADRGVSVVSAETPFVSLLSTSREFTEDE